MNIQTLTILIIEDDEDTLDQLQKLLREEFPDSEILGAVDVLTGKKLIDQTRTIDVVILDFQLPARTGGYVIDTTLCKAVRSRHIDCLVIHFTGHPTDKEVEMHMAEVHSPNLPTEGDGNPMETLHLGILISKRNGKDSDPDDPGETEKLGDEIIEAIRRRQKLKVIEAGLAELLDEGIGEHSGSRRGMGRVAVPDSGLTGHIGSLSLALEEAWHWLPERTKNRARQLFTIHDVPNAPGKVYIQML